MLLLLVVCIFYRFFVYFILPYLGFFFLKEKMLNWVEFLYILFFTNNLSLKYMEWSIYEANQTMIWLIVKELQNPFVNSFLPSNPIFFFFFFIVCWNSECIKGMLIFFFFFSEQVRNFFKLKKSTRIKKTCISPRPATCSWP